jgi:hypothetical protein
MMIIVMSRNSRNSSSQEPINQILKIDRASNNRIQPVGESIKVHQIFHKME